MKKSNLERPEGRLSGRRDLREELATEFDPRLADIWLTVFELWPETEMPEELGWFLRMAYLQGYGDALSETERGSLFRGLGMQDPGRPAGRHAAARGEGQRA